MKDGRLLLKDKHGHTVKKIMIHHPTISSVDREKEKLKKHFNMNYFIIDDSDFHLLYEKGHKHVSKK